MAAIARLTFETSSIDPSVLKIAGVKGEEHLSRLYRFDLDLTSVEPDLKFADLVSKPALLTMAVGADTTRVQGLVADFEQRGFSTDVARYRAVLVPRVWLLTLNFQSRIFQEVSIKEIITKVVADGGLPAEVIRFDLSITYPVREYCAQFQESDWNFICRLMEREGIFFFFEEGDQGEVMVISDQSSNCPAAALSDEAAFVPNAVSLLNAQDGPIIHEVGFREKVGAGNAQMKDYNYRTPNVDLFTSSELNLDAPGFAYEFGGNHKDPKEGERLARVRFEEMACARTRLTGGSNIPTFRPGRTFDLTLGPGFRSDIDAKYLLTHVTHVGAQGSGLATSGGVEGATYRNEFVGLPARLPYRPPRRTPVPRVPGLMTAITESKGGDHPDIDEEGRYRMRMHFDLRDEVITPVAEASHPIRMKQTLSGPGVGWHSPNPEGTEMIVAYVNGDPDRPLALGTAPNPSQKSPSTSANKAESVYRTRSGNELTFDDTVGKENISMVAVKDRHTAVVNDDALDVSNNRTMTVRRNESNTVKGSRSASVGGDDTLTVGAKQTVAVQGNASLEVKNGDRLVDVKGNYVAVATRNMTLAGRDNGVKIFGKGEEGIVLDGTGSMGVSIGGKPNFYATGSEKAGLYSKLVSLRADDKVTIDAPLVEVRGDEIKLTAGGSSITIKPSGIEITSSGPVTVKGLEIKLNS